jgi:hypothetical protein
MMSNFNQKPENEHLFGFVDFINSKSGTIRKPIGFGRSKPKIPNQLLFEISSVALVVGFMPSVICSLEGNKLTVDNNTKKLSSDQMDNLYDFIEQKNNNGDFLYIGSYFDLTINDGNSHSYFINWNGIKSEGSGGHTMSSGLNELIEYCTNLVNK